MTRRSAPAAVALVTLAAALLCGCARAPVTDIASANQDDRIRFLVLHYTDEPFDRALDLLTRPHPNPVSAHYLVSRAGDGGRAVPHVFRLVDESRRAWHAGASRWQGHEPLNGESIGVEIVYVSHCDRSARSADASPWAADANCPYRDFPRDQIAAVIALARDVLRRHPQIEPTRVVGHSDVQPENKTDPGPRFPWRELAAAGVGAWYEEADVAHYRAAFAAAPPDPQLLREAFAAYGYGLQANGAGALRWGDIVSAFQSHFLPQHRSGSADTETAATLFALLARYRRPELQRLRARFAQLPAPR